MAARGEIADLKDTINQMIAALRTTTEANAQQGWLDSNLARIGGLMEGQRELGDHALSAACDPCTMVTSP